MAALVASQAAVPAGAAAAAARPPGQVLDASAIRVEQDNVVTVNHQAPLSVARLAVADFSAATARDELAVAADRAAQATAASRAAAAAVRLSGDRQALEADDQSVSEDGVRLSRDRAQLGAIAIGMYTGALTNPQPASLQQLEAEQNRVIDAAEVEVVAGVVVAHLHSDLRRAALDQRRRDAAARQVRDDQATQAREVAAAAAAASRISADAARLVADRAQLAGATSRLHAAEADLAAALQSVAGPPSAPVGQLSILGGSALTAAQLADWYNAQGYVDFTSATIGQLASWYIQDGLEEGVRGDVAFAQAVLETGGFSSPDAVDLSNFAGIGHCDTCSAGWAFPSPQAGVLGQEQLLRIFADRGPSPPSAPSPVLPTLTPGQQMSAGCCSTVEALTGVWATDPTYGQQILYIYAQMLGYALATSHPA